MYVTAQYVYGLSWHGKELCLKSYHVKGHFLDNLRGWCTFADRRLNRELEVQTGSVNSDLTSKSANAGLGYIVSVTSMTDHPMVSNGSTFFMGKLNLNARCEWPESVRRCRFWDKKGKLKFDDCPQSCPSHFIVRPLISHRSPYSDHRASSLKSLANYKTKFKL
jgi:hypothetical protein